MQLQDLQFVSHTFRSPLPGPKLIITGAVHGNEICGTLAIRRLLEQLQSGALQLISGQLTLVPVCNPLAYAKGERQGDRNLNRRLIPTAHVQEFEDHVANWLCPLLAAHEVLLDLHSFRGAGEPFVLVGPENNQGEIEPFRHAEAELAMAARLGVQRMVDGWLSTYAHGVARRQQALAPDADAKTRANADTRFGVGTTEYMRSVGGYAVTLECGQHEDPQAADVAWRAIDNTLRHLGLIAGSPPDLQAQIETLRIYDVIDKQHQDDVFCRDWYSFDTVSAGDLIGTRADGTAVRASMDGRIIFPDAAAGAGEEWFYITRYSDRLAGVV
jgi:predicted deacylase